MFSPVNLLVSVISTIAAVDMEGRIFFAYLMLYNKAWFFQGMHPKGRADVADVKAVMTP